jgi:hypothetical protein
MLVVTIFAFPVNDTPCTVWKLTAVYESWQSQQLSCHCILLHRYRDWVLTVMKLQRMGVSGVVLSHNPRYCELCYGTCIYILLVPSMMVHSWFLSCLLPYEYVVRLRA